MTPKLCQLHWLEAHPSQGKPALRAVYGPPNEEHQPQQPDAGGIEDRRNPQEPFPGQQRGDEKRPRPNPNRYKLPREELQHPRTACGAVDADEPNTDQHHQQQ
jgi:hypothetical protein